MGKIEEWLENMSEKENRKMEAGRGPGGEMSEEELKKWLQWALVALLACAILTGLWAVVSSVRNRKEAAILEVDSGTVLELYLNRKGTILKAKGAAENVLNDYSLEEGIDKLLDGLAEYGRLGEGGAVIFTLRSVEGGIQTDLERLAEEIYVHSELFLRKRHSGGTIYVDVLEGDEIAVDVVQKYGVSYGKAALARNLLDKNTELKNSDLERLLGMSVDEISAEITEEKYDTAFVIVTAKQIYAKWQELEESTKRESSAEAPGSDDAAAGAGDASGLTETVLEEALQDAAQGAGGFGTAEEDENIQEGQVAPENMVNAEESDEALEAAQTQATAGAATKGTTAAAATTVATKGTTAAATTAAATRATTAAATKATTAAATRATTAAATEAATKATTAAATEAATKATTAAATQATTAAPTQAATETETTAANHGTLTPAPGSAAGGSIIQEVIPVSPGN